MDRSFRFGLGQHVLISESGESGVVIGCAMYSYCANSYFIRYKAADGRAVEQWWSQDALQEVTGQCRTVTGQ